MRCAIHGQLHGCFFYCSNTSLAVIYPDHGIIDIIRLTYSQVISYGNIVKHLAIMMMIILLRIWIQIRRQSCNTWIVEV